MSLRSLSLLAAVGLVVAPVPATPARAQEGPAIIVRVSSVDNLLADAKFLATLAGQGEQATQIEKMVQAKVGKEGWDGIDTKRPVGMYATINPDNPQASQAVVLIPVADEKAFLDLLDRLNLAPAKDGDSYTVKAPNIPFPIYFRFANRYAYATALNPSAIDKENLLDPAKALPAGTGVVSATIRVDRIPDNLKQLALSRLELALADAMEEKKPNEKEAERQLRVQLIKEMAKQVTAVIKDGQEVAARVDIDRTADQIAVEVTLDGKPGSKLAAGIAAYGKAPTVFGALGGDAAMAGLVHYVFPEGLRKAFDEFVDKALADALEKEADPAKRAEAEKLLKALEPSLKSGEIDAAFSLRGPNDDRLYTGVGGIKLKDGLRVEKALRDLLAKLPEGDRAKIKLDVATASTTKVHQIEVNDLDRNARLTFGDTPALFVAFRDDAVFLALGDDGLAAIKDAVAAKPVAGPLVKMEMSVKRAAPLMAHENKKAVPAAQVAFGSAVDQDRVQLTVQGGDALKVRFAMKAPVVKFLREMDAKKANAND